MNNELSHFGILGMKWGVRRSESQLSRNLKGDPSAGKVPRYKRNSARKNLSSDQKDTIARQKEASIESGKILTSKALLTLGGIAIAKAAYNIATGKSVAETMIYAASASAALGVATGIEKQQRKNR